MVALEWGFELVLMFIKHARRTREGREKDARKTRRTRAVDAVGVGWRAALVVADPRSGRRGRAVVCQNGTAAMAWFVL